VLSSAAVWWKGSHALLAQLLLVQLSVKLQVYAASIMFGYFLRRVDRRFQLESALGVLKEGDHEEAVARLERLFAQVHKWLLLSLLQG